jgi:hypothetical protein
LKAGREGLLECSSNQTRSNYASVSLAEQNKS